MRAARKGKKGQISVEALVLIGAVLVVGIVLFTYANDAVRDFNVYLSTMQARLAVSKTGDAATRVYRQGAGARDTIWLLLPRGTRSFNALDRTLLLEVDIGTTTSFHETLSFNVSGELPAEAGLLRLQLNSTSAGVVIGVAP